MSSWYLQKHVVVVGDPVVVNVGGAPVVVV